MCAYDRAFYTPANRTRACRSAIVSCSYCTRCARVPLGGGVESFHIQKSIACVCIRRAKSTIGAGELGKKSRGKRRAAEELQLIASTGFWTKKIPRLLRHSWSQL